MNINFIIGKSEAGNYYNKIKDSQKIMESLTFENKSLKQYKYTSYISDSVFVDFDKYLSKYNKFTVGQKIYYLLQYVIDNKTNNIYFLSNNLDINVFETFIKTWRDKITINYFNDEDIIIIKDKDNLEFKKLIKEECLN